MTLRLGSKLARFEITGVLGEGAMGTVYLAHDPQIERPVAIKTLRPDAGGEQRGEIASRFLKEAKLAGRLQHPNIVTIYEAGRDQGVDFIAMEYVDGVPLTRMLPDAGFSLPQRVEVVRQVALALEHAHERGVLHRDIKPGNILITRDGSVKVADFGIGKLLAAGGELTRTGQMIGSPAYMSPEQIRGEKLDGRSDFFSLGVVFYELLTASRPFPGDTITTLVYQILHSEPRDPLRLRSDLPRSTREVFARLLAKSPDRRPADARDFLREVGAIERELSVSVQTTPLAAPVPWRQEEAAPARQPGGAGARPTGNRRAARLQRPRHVSLRGGGAPAGGGDPRRDLAASAAGRHRSGGRVFLRRPHGGAGARDGRRRRGSRACPCRDGGAAADARSPRGRRRERWRAARKRGCRPAASDRLHAGGAKGACARAARAARGA